jgi:hypothetical protein
MPLREDDLAPIMLCRSSDSLWNFTSPPAHFPRSRCKSFAPPWPGFVSHEFVHLKIVI